ncbi:MFS transporter [Rhodoferax lacus]|uniref:MFS transporter n=1 Tax=Rhodoferax lacus TaxID=2184758 RepID=A0A3E1RCD3_9BURK|nr:PucC family protein [Rhodoferax lacus]RFO97028.1 MFS transporter [Rhodoferax lacus]
MNRISQKLVFAWASVGPRFLPFADVATAELPLSRLLRLSLFQVSVGMAIVLLVGTLNRVMIVELKVPTALVSVMVGLPLFFAPLRALIGFKSDHHTSALGWRRVPYMWMGTMLQFGGFAIMPFALLVLSGGGNAAQAPAWIGHLGAGVAFLLVGAGLHTTQTVGLALATDLAAPESRPKVVGLMCVMLLVGMICSAFFFGELLADYSPARLVQVIQGAALITLVLNVVALWKQEARSRTRQARPQADPTFQESWAVFCSGPRSVRRLLVLGMGTMAFSMEDVLLEPFGGEILHLSVSSTTTLTATLAFGGLAGFAWASRVLSRGMDPFRMAALGVCCGIPAFVAVIASAPMQSPLLFGLGTFLIGLGAGMFGHGTLTATMNLAPKDQAGLALGAWGAVQATCAGLAMALGGVLRDAVAHAYDSVTGYSTVYSLEVLLLCATLVAMYPLFIRNPKETP